MNDKELEELKEQVEKAGNLKREIARLETAIKTLIDKTTDAILLNFGIGSQAIAYRNVGQTEWKNVCWAQDYPSLTVEIREAVENILQDYLNTIIEEYNAL